MADWDLSPLLLRQVLFTLQGANWQRSGGKGQKPKPLDLPNDRTRGDQPAQSSSSAPDIAQRLRNLGMLPAGASD